MVHRSRLIGSNIKHQSFIIVLKKLDKRKLLIPIICIIFRNMIPRLIETQVFERMPTIHKTIILLVAHQVGKTTLFITLQSRLTQDGKSVRYLNCDLEEERQAIDATSRTLLDRSVAGKDAILINEVQRLDNPGLTLKTLVDLYPQLTILVTGSSNFGLDSQVNEAMNVFVSVKLTWLAIPVGSSATSFAGNQQSSRVVAARSVDRGYKYKTIVCSNPTLFTCQALTLKDDGSYSPNFAN
jgi:hypothetical protein